MGDYVNNNNKEQGLFVFSPQEFYNSNNATKTTFSYFCDYRYIDLSTDLLDKYFI